ncbi:MAG: hypothetical protein WCF22_06010 [Candidatus Sulfotelmatobacter sp.]
MKTARLQVLTTPAFRDYPPSCSVSLFSSLFNDALEFYNGS